MKVDVYEREEQFDDLREDDRLIDLLDAVSERRWLLSLLIELIRLFERDANLKQGVKGQSAQTFAASFARAKRRSDTERKAIRKVVSRLEGLYSAYAGHEHLLRGFIVEMLVKRALRPHYAATGDILADNVKFSLENGHEYRSSRTIDVIAFERTRSLGEVHDCKLQASGWKKPKAISWVRELESHAASRGMRVGLVTITATDRARVILDQASIGRSSQLVCLERLWDFVPLNAA